MLSRPSGLNEGDGGGQGLGASQHPATLLAEDVPGEHRDFHLATPPDDDRKWDSGHHDNVRKLDSGRHDIKRKWDSGHHNNDRKKAAEVDHSERLRGGFSRTSPWTCSFNAPPSIPSPLSLSPSSSSLLSASPPPSLVPPTTPTPLFPLPMTPPLSLAPPPPHSCTSLGPPALSPSSPLTITPLPSSLFSAPPPPSSLQSAPPPSPFPPSYLAPPSPPLTSLLPAPPSSFLSPPRSSLAPPMAHSLPFTSPPPPCPCTSLPRLLASHRAEVRRLLRGALASLGRRLAVVERRAELLGRRRRQKKKKKRHKGGGAGAAMPGSAPLPSSSSSTEEEADYGKGGREEEEDDCGRRKRRKEEEDCGRREEEDCGRFVGRMAVSFEGEGREEARLTLRNLGRKHKGREVGSSPFLPLAQSGSSPLPRRQNGVANHQLLATVGSRYPEGHVPVILHSAASSFQHALRLLQAPAGQLDPSTFLSIGWCFSASLAPPLIFSLASSNPDTFRLWLRLSSSPFSSVSLASLLCLSPVAVETVWGGICRRPLPPLKDYTAPPSLDNDHCYVRLSPPSLPAAARRQRKQQDNHSTRSLRPRRPLSLPPCSANGPPPCLDSSQLPSSAEYQGRKGERVSQIRIRRATPRGGTELTPLGLPKVKRLKKKEFSLEEIYTNKNYKSPTPNRSLETIFEEPREKDGVLLLIGHQRRRRLLLFPDFTQPRKRRRPQGAGPRKRATARRHCHGEEEEEDPDVMLVERLSALEDFLSRQGLDS